jgi:hypothetical protein
MKASAIVDIQGTHGAAFIGLLVSFMCVFKISFSFSPPPLTWPTHSLLGMTAIQGWVKKCFSQVVALLTRIIQMDILRVTNSDSLALLYEVNSL